MAKKNVLLFISGIMSVGLLIWDYIGNYRLCGGKEWGDCVDMLANIEIIFLPILPLFLFSLITYKMSEEVFQSWFRFARIYVPVSMLLILLAPSYSSNWMFPYDKGRAALIFSFLFIIISIIKIILAYRRSK